MRYDQLLTIIDDIKPRFIVEVGVARAERGVAMCERALTYRPDVQYLGYDVFETANAAFHAAAFNLKKVDSRAACAAKLASIQGRHKKFQFDLVVGDTRETLLGADIVADLAFIDGDHRVAAIRHDYQALWNSAVVVLDDYYVADERGCPDISKVGCNSIVDAMNGKATLLPESDQVTGGGRVKMAIIRACSTDA